MDTVSQLQQQDGAPYGSVIDRLLHKRVFQGLLRGDPSSARELTVLYGKKAPSDVQDDRYRIYLCSPYFMLLMFGDIEKGGYTVTRSDMFGWSKGEKELRLDNIIHYMFEDALHALGDTYHLEVDGRECLLINLKDFDEEDVESSGQEKAELIKFCASQAAFTVWREYGISLSVAVTSACRGCENIQRLFREAKRLSEYQQVLDYCEPVISYYDVKDRSLSYSELSRKKDLERKFLLTVMSYDYSSACQYLQELLDCCCRDKFTAVASLQMKVMNHVNYALGSQFLDIYTESADDYGIVVCAREIQMLRSLKLTKHRLEDLFLKLARCHADNRLSDNARVVSLLQYIETNYSNPNLDISMICRDNHISQQHCVSLLRQHTGRGTLETIHYIRIQAAKRLLKHTDETMASISAQVGYTNQWTFFRSFKKLEGITPGDYRIVSREDKQ